MAKAKDSWRLRRAVATLRAVETRDGLLLLRRVIGSRAGLAGGVVCNGGLGAASICCSTPMWDVEVVGVDDVFDGSVAIVSTVSGRGVVKKSVPRVPIDALELSMSWSLSFGLLTGNSIGVAEVVGLGRMGDVEVDFSGGCSMGSFNKDTSRRSEGLVPRPGKRTRVAPFAQEPTAIPKSPVWLYFPVWGLAGLLRLDNRMGT